jgi:glycosyltransferase involved in cell wall biosynthesis
MKLVTHTDTSVGKDMTDVRSPIIVCMHVRGVARTDARVMREATALVKAGFAVSIVDIEQEYSRPTQENISGVCVKHIFLPGSFDSSRFKLWSLVKVVKSRIYSVYRIMQLPADIYHAHDVSALPACYIAARLRRKPLIFDSHELPLCNLAGSPWFRFKKLFALILAAIIPRFAGVITVSPPIVQEMRNCYHARKVALIRNLHSFQVVSKSDRLRHFLSLGPEIRIALYQGNLQPSSGLDILVHAACFLEPDIVIVMMGKGVGTTPIELEALIARQGVADRVKIIPPVPYEELLDWTASADIGLTTLPPNYSESIRMCLPNKLFEYLMAGLPVLTSQLDAVVDILHTHQVGQVVSSLAPADVAAAINTILADHVALDRMRRNAQEVAQHEFYWEKESQMLIRFYYDILGMQNEIQSNPCSTSRDIEREYHANSSSA